MISSRTILLLLGATACCAWGHAQTAIGNLTASDASVQGAVIVSAKDTRLLSGSSVSAGQDAASLQLTRGGEVRVCPRSSLSVTASQSGKELMLALGTGAIETHYRLSGSADIVLTPDFRIMLAGPGIFHFAFFSDVHGNTCVRALPFDSSSVIVSELMGDGVYQVGPGEQAWFRGGTVKDANNQVPPDCGCPAPVATPRREVAATGPASAGDGPDSSVTAPLPPTAPDEVKVTVDAPFVFRADDVPAIPSAPLVATLRLEQMAGLMLPPPLPPAPAASPAGPTARPQPKSDAAEKKGLLRRLRSLLTTIFR
jgi:hypothetical protein